MTGEVAGSLQGLGSFLTYFGLALAAEVVFIALYMAITPHQEIALIRGGNAAAAISLAGAVLGFTVPLASALIHSVSLLDMAVWSAVALLVQVSVFLAASIFSRGLSRRIEDGNIAAALALAAVSLSVGVLNAASMTY